MLSFQPTYTPILSRVIFSRCRSSFASLVAGRPFIMSSRADSTSPPPYSFEVSSFPPPPPRQGEVARNWEFQSKFESAEEPVRQAVRKYRFGVVALSKLMSTTVDTITAWTALPNPTVWEYIPRCNIQDGYDSASADLRRALGPLIRQSCDVLADSDPCRFLNRLQLYHISFG